MENNLGNIQEVRYPCALGERAFTVKSIGGCFNPYILVVGNIEDLTRHFKEHHSSEDEIIINYKTNVITVHDGYLY